MIPRRLIAWALALILAAAFPATAHADSTKPKKRMVTRPLGQRRVKTVTTAASSASPASPSASPAAPPSKRVVINPNAPVARPVTAEILTAQPVPAPAPAETAPHKPAVTVIVHPGTGAFKMEES